MNALKSIIILIAVALLLMAGLSAIQRPPEPPPLQQHHLSALILESRQTAVAGESGIGVGWVVALMLLMLLTGGALLWFHFGANYLKQLRLTRKAAKRKSRPAPRLPTVPEMRPPPLLQEVHEESNR